MHYRNQTTIDEFLQQIGVAEYDAMSMESFWQQLKGQHGDTARAVHQAIEEHQPRQKSNVYALKNVDLDVSLAITSYFLGPVYRSYMKWFNILNIYAFHNPSSLLDLGCDNGVLTCFYAYFYPDAEVVGIEQTAEGVACAKQLASKLNLTNVTFYQGDVTDLKSTLGSRKFDCITATLLYNDAIGLPNDTASWSIFDLEMPAPTEEQVGAVKQLHSFLKEDGHLVSLERCASTSTHYWWANLIKDAGFELDTDCSMMLKCGGPEGYEQRMPLLVSTPNPNTQNNPYTPQDILAFRSGDKLDDLFEEAELDEEMSEALFLSFNAKKFVSGVEAHYYDEDGIMRVELWDTGFVLLHYFYTNLGFRKLLIKPKVPYEQAKLLLEEHADELSMYGDIHFYEQTRTRHA